MGDNPVCDYSFWMNYLKIKNSVMQSNEFIYCKNMVGLILILFFAKVGFAGTIILPDNPNIQYVGRFDQSNPKAPTFAWTGTEIIANFEGTSLQVLLRCTARTYFNVTIDDVTSVLIATDINTIYSLCNGLKNKKHSVVIFKRDSPWITVTFSGFILDDYKNVLAPPPRKNRKIEFYGDSQTQGAQVEVPGFNPDLNQMIDDNNYFSYDAITARALDAEYSCIAKNGASITPKNGESAIPDLFERIGPDSSFAKWDFNLWKPDVICVNLGVNDPPKNSDFESRYLRFVKNLRAIHSKAPIFLLSGPLWNNDTIRNSIINVVKTMNANGDSNVYYLGFKTTVTHPGHPRTAENVACSKELVDKIKSISWCESIPDLTVEDVYIMPITDELNIGKTLQLSATVSPFDVKDKNVKWIVSDSGIATVDSTGLVTAKAVGKVIITVFSKDEKKFASCTVRVTETQNNVH